MNEYRHGDWYCVPANESEAREIVERAVASGAILIERVRTDGLTGYRWNMCNAWGVRLGETFTTYADKGESFRSAIQYTIEELRQKFPLPGEQVEEPKQWRGPEDGLPPVGTVCRIRKDDDAHESYKRFCGKAAEVVAHTNGKNYEMAVFKVRDDEGFYDFHGLVAECFEPLPTEREKWVEQSLKVLQKDPCALPSQLMGMIYDAIQSGELKSPRATFDMGEPA